MINPDCLQGYEFLDKFIKDYKNMEDIGFNRNQILNMLSTQKYVQDFIETPEWLVSAGKLPEGYKWSDGTKYHVKGGKKSESETYIFLSIGNDLYIKGLLDGAYELVNREAVNEYGVPELYSIRDKRICVIKDWKSKKDYKVNDRIGVSVFFQNSLSNFWRDNGGKMSYQEDNEIADCIAKAMFGRRRR